MNRMFSFLTHMGYPLWLTKKEISFFEKIFFTKVPLENGARILCGNETGSNPRCAVFCYQHKKDGHWTVCTVDPGRYAG